MMATRGWMIAIVFSLLVGCGAQPGEGDGGQPSAYETPDLVPGIYAMDVARQTGGKTHDKDGKEIQLTDEQIAKLQKNHGADSFRIELKEDGTFEMTMGDGEQAFRTGGTWKETARGVEMVTTTINGEPAGAEVAQVTEVYQREKGYLIGEQQGVRVYLKKRLEPLEPAAPKTP